MGKVCVLFLSLYFQNWNFWNLSELKYDEILHDVLHVLDVVYVQKSYTLKKKNPDARFLSSAEDVLVHVPSYCWLTNWLSMSVRICTGSAYVLHVTTQVDTETVSQSEFKYDGIICGMHILPKFLMTLYVVIIHTLNTFRTLWRSLFSCASITNEYYS